MEHEPRKKPVDFGVRARDTPRHLVCMWDRVTPAILGIFYPVFVLFNSNDFARSAALAEVYALLSAVPVSFSIYFIYFFISS